MTGRNHLLPKWFEYKSLLKSILFFFCLVGYNHVHAWTIELTEDELQEKINKRVPIEKKKLIFTVLVDRIDVQLEENSDRIGLLAHMEIRSPHLTTGKGQAKLDGKLEYDEKQAQFYLREPQVRQVEFENIPEKYHGLLRKVFQRAISRRLANMPVYKLDQSRTKHQIARSLLKSVKVIDARLVLEMGFF